MYLYDHRTTLLSLHVVNFSGRTDTEAGRDFISWSHCSSHRVQPDMPITRVTLSGHCTGTGPFLLWSCLRVGDALVPITLWNNFGSQFPFPCIKENKAFNIVMGPKTVGPWRKPVKIFEVKIYFCVPQITTFLFKNLLRSVSPENAGVDIREVTERKGGIKAKVFCISYCKSVFELAFLVRCVFRKKYSRVSRTAELTGKAAWRQYWHCEAETILMLK